MAGAEPDTGWAHRLRQRTRGALHESLEVHRRLWSAPTLRVLAIGLPLSLLAGRHTDQALHGLTLRLTENYAAQVPVLLGGAIFRITLVILYIYSLHPTGYIVTVGCGLASSIIYSLTYSIFDSPRELLTASSLLDSTLSAQVAVVGAIDTVLNGRFFPHLFLHIVLLVGSSSHRVLSLYVAGATVGTAYALAAQSLRRSRKDEEERVLRAGYERKKAESERRSALPLLENLRIIVQQTPTAKLPVAIDFPRLAPKIEITDINGQVLVPLVRDSVRPAESQMRDILLHLGACTAANDVVQCVQDRFAECFESDSSAAKSLDRMTARFISGEFIADTSKPVLILRACNQAAISPAVLALKTTIGQKLPYKDIRGEWWIRISFSHDAVYVTHEKREQSWTTKPGFEFQFAWELRFTFSADLSELRATSLRIKELTFADAAPEDYRDGVREQMKLYYQP